MELCPGIKVHVSTTAQLLCVDNSTTAQWCREKYAHLANSQLKKKL